jgi:hypothetical protein
MVEAIRCGGIRCAAITYNRRGYQRPGFLEDDESLVDCPFLYPLEVVDIAGDMARVSF